MTPKRGRSFREGEAVTYSGNSENHGVDIKGGQHYRNEYR